MGITIFFALAGYLITDLLIQEWEQNGKIYFTGFYFRRFKRLYPALVVMLITTGAYITLFQKNFLVNLKSAIFTNLAFLNNWWGIGHSQNYFSLKLTSPFSDLWSLSVIGQYYLIWPILLTGLVVVIKNKRVISTLLLGISIGSAVLMGMLYSGTSTIDRVYLGTDTRLFSIVLGSLLAIVWPSTHLKTKITNGSRWLLNWIGIISLGLMIGLLFNVNGQSASVYHGLMFLMSVLATALIATCVHPGSNINRWLTNPIFTWLGTRSYGIFLYQLPIIVFYESRVKDYAVHPVISSLIILILIAIVSEISYRCIENPLRKIRYYQLKQLAKNILKFDNKHKLKFLWILLTVLIFVICNYGMTIRVPNYEYKNNLKLALNKQQNTLNSRNILALTNQQQTKITSDRKLTVSQFMEARKYGLTKQQYLNVAEIPITAIGDSILVNNGTDLQNVFQKVYISASIDYQMTKIKTELQHLRVEQHLSGIVLVDLGNSKACSKNQMEQLVQYIGKDQTIFWVNYHLPNKSNENRLNASINQIAEQHKNVHIIDWHTTSASHANWFLKDQLHLNKLGTINYTHLVATQISNYINKKR
ncbi:acyltransferase [Lentilactobacillus laojiaonis]|nr:acyltransferase family protein [Lentilactobacillus laojiaonis]UDM32525.1 acyltransferase [Lentilactobacillus laojiaonis]